ncbi:MAG: DUF333 domain-containing protein [Anaerolineae bacterium]
MKTFLGTGRGAAIVLLLLSGLIASCGVPTQADRPGRAQIDDVDVQILESFPVQAEVVITGNLPDSCTKIEQIDTRLDTEESIFWVEVRTIRDTDEVCAQALVPFEETVPLDVYGLPAGTYTVDVNGTREAFKLSVDNAPPDAGLPNPASVYCQEQGYALEIRTDEEGNQVGVCIFPDGSECDEWTFFRGECGPAD